MHGIFCTNPCQLHGVETGSGGDKKKHKIVSLWDSFHGASLDAISAGGESVEDLQTAISILKAAISKYS